MLIIVKKCVAVRKFTFYSINADGYQQIFVLYSNATSYYSGVACILLLAFYTNY